MLLVVGKKRTYGILILLLICSLFTWVAHIWITDRFAIYKFFYHFESFLARFTVTCTNSAAAWLEQLVVYSLKERGALANQAAYISPSGELSSCSSGWRQGFLKGEQVDANVRFRYASTTKIITADLILTLVNEKKLQLNSTIEQLFPEVQSYQDDRVRGITVEQLLNHTAGFNRITSGDPMFFFNKKPWCPYGVEGLSELKLQFSPGENQVYANLSYCLLGVIAERVVGAPYREMVEQRYSLSQLGIVFLDGPLLADEVLPDFRNDSFYTETYHKFYDFYAVSSSAGLSGSASALARLVSGVLASPGSMLRAPSSYSNCDEEKFRGCYGYAFYKYKQADSDLVVHIQDGYLHGSSSVVIADDRGGVLVLLNAGKPAEAFTVNKKTYKKIYTALSDFYSPANFE